MGFSVKKEGHAQTCAFFPSKNAKKSVFLTSKIGTVGEYALISQNSMCVVSKSTRILEFPST